MAVLTKCLLFLRSLSKSIATLAAAAYTCTEFWNYKVTFTAPLGVFNNNAHLYGPTLMKLIYDFTTYDCTSSSSPADNNTILQSASDQMKRHVNIATSLLMTQKRLQKDRPESKMPLQLMIYSLQMTVLTAKNLVGTYNMYWDSVLCLPFLT